MRLRPLGIISSILLLPCSAILPLAAQASDSPNDCSSCQVQGPAGTETAEKLASDGIFLELGESLPPESDSIENAGKIGYDTSCWETKSVAYCKDSKKRLVEFKLTNRGSPRTVPYGTREFDSAYREFAFSFRQRAKQDMKLSVTEFSIPGAPISHTEMNTSFYFFPRKVLPSVKENGDKLVVSLPTGEEVLFDAKTKEIIGGALKEDGPMDNSPDRHKRKFAAISYHGKGVVIRADQRGELPEHDMVWGNTKNAVISHKGKQCRVRAKDLWNQKDSETAYFLFPTDEEFAQKILIGKCGWKGPFF